MDPERRFAEFRVAGRTLTGRAIVYGDISPTFRERFEPGAFGDLPSVPLNLQHDLSMVILEAGAYALTDGPHALEVRAELPERSAVLSLVQRRALSGFSIEFHSRAERREGGIKVIERAELTAIALVDRPSYPRSGAEVRMASWGALPPGFVL